MCPEDEKAAVRGCGDDYPSPSVQYHFEKPDPEDWIGSYKNDSSIWPGGPPSKDSHVLLQSIGWIV